MNTNMDNFHLEAHKYLGVPFRHRGRTTRGMDCVGLLIRTAMDCGYDKYEEFPYGREPRNSVLEGVLEYHFGPPIDREPQINDVVLLRLRSMLEPSHVGIITNHPNGLGIIHAYGEIGKVALHRYTKDMAKRLVGVYVWPEKS